MRRLLVAGAMLATAFAAQTGKAQEVPPLDPTNVLSWPRTSVDRFGCMMERELDIRDPRFNCALRNYVNRGNACTGTDAYYEGPAFPADRAERVMAQFESLSIAYEGGRVQAVTLILKQRQTQTAIRALLNLPPPRAALPANLTTVSIQGCRPDGATQICNVVLLEGFDHIGAGDADCGEEGVRPEPTPEPAATPPGGN